MFPRGLLKEYATTLSYFARLLDILCVSAGGLLAFLWRFDNLHLPAKYQIAILLAVLLTFIIFPLSRIYKSWRGNRWMYQARIVTMAWIIVVSTLIIIAFLTKSSEIYSRQWMAMWVMTTWSLILLSRLLLHYGLRILRARGLNRKRIVIIGAGTLGRQLAKNINQAEWTGFEITAFLDDDELLHGKVIEGVKVDGDIRQVKAFIDKVDIDEILIALPLAAKDRIEYVMDVLKTSTKTVRYVPDIGGLRLINHSITEFAGMPVLNLTESPMNGINLVVKEVEDRLISALILILISPILIALAIGVKLSSRGPVFYKQERMSWNGRKFSMLKFRSMPVNVESSTGPVWAKQGVNRATKFGSFLRRTSLDELPQFFNVLKGDMSIVGPRPERPVFVDKFKEEIPNYMQKHLVKAGITGWAQVNGWRGDTCLKTRIEHDLYYVEHWSLWFDFKIIFMTLFKGFVHKNAY